MKCHEPGCDRDSRDCVEHWQKCMHCQQRAAFALMSRPECTNCWEVRSRLNQFLQSETNLAFVAKLLRDKLK